MATNGSTATTGGTSGGSTGATGGGNAPTWAAGVSAVFVTNCGTCHGASTAPDFSFFDSSTQPSSSTMPSLMDVCTAVSTGSMPMTPVTITDADKTTIANWCSGGGN